MRSWCTLLELMRQQIASTEGEVERSGKLKIGHYNQHSEEVLDMEKTSLNFVKDLCPLGITTKAGSKKMENEDERGKHWMWI